MNDPDDLLYLCATSRLARRLQLAGGEGRRTWRPPAAMALDVWFQAQTEAALLSGVLPPRRTLTPLAERLLWEKLIGAALDASGEAGALFDITGLAAHAAEAEALRQVWSLPLAEMMAGGDEARAFARWRQSFRDELKAYGWQTQTDAHLAVLTALEGGHLALPAKVQLAGFDILTPLHERLVAALRQRGCAVEGPPNPGFPDGNADQQPCDDPAAECRAIAAWAAQQRRFDPQARLGIVVSDLAAYRERLTLALDAALHPELAAPEHAEAPRDYNLSLGRPLAGLPLADAALAWLSAGVKPQAVEQAVLSKLLRSPYGSDGVAEADARARLEARMRRKCPLRLGLDALYGLALPMREALPRWLADLDRVRAVLSRPGARKRLPSQWGGFFTEILAAVGWPGSRGLSSHEYQAQAAFAECLADLKAFDAIGGRIGAGDALAWVRRMARERLFQPQTRGEPPIQVLGVLESAGLPFSALWVAGFDAAHWPGEARPNPLLPAALQRRHGVTHASAEVEGRFARQVYTRLRGSAPVVHFSWARVDDEGRERAASALLAGVPLRVPGPGPVSPVAESVAQESIALDSLDDPCGPPIPAGEEVSGGTALLAAQAVCPAWAFYRYRLGACALETPVQGLDEAGRGSLLHAVQEAFWGRIDSSAALAALTEADEAAAVVVAVADGIAAFEAKNGALKPRFRALEAERLAALLRQWLALERTRTTDFRVEARETPVELDLEGMHFSLLIDRIDRLADGSLAVLDYKTGRADMKEWWGARIRAPQLPLYATLARFAPQDSGDVPVTAVAFAHVKADKMRFVGVADATGRLPGLQVVGQGNGRNTPPYADWTALKQAWQEGLTALAREFRTGHAEVRFERLADLRYCEVKPLLRLAEAEGLMPGAEVELETEGGADV